MPHLIELASDGVSGKAVLFYVPRSAWENGHLELFNGKFGDELLNVEIIDTLWEAQVLTERCRREHNTVMPHSVLNYRAPAPKAVQLRPEDEA